MELNLPLPFHVAQAADHSYRLWGHNFNHDSKIISYKPYKSQSWHGSPWVAKLDKRGRLACTKTDKCKGIKVSTACTDANICTLDLCREDVGCINPNIEDGAYCGFGKVCKKGACVLK